MKRMTVPLVWVLLFALLVITVGLAQPTPDQGKAVFDKRCKMCHGADGKGNPAIARMLKVEFKPLESEPVQKLTDQEIKDIILKGKGKMVAVRGVSESEVTQVTAYLRSLKK